MTKLGLFDLGKGSKHGNFTKKWGVLFLRTSIRAWLIKCLPMLYLISLVTNVFWTTFSVWFCYKSDYNNCILHLCLHCDIPMTALSCYRSSKPINGASQKTVYLFEEASAAERGMHK